MEPFVSFIIPTLNSSATLKACLDSILSQNYPSNRFEIIIADGGSSDSTVKIAEDAGARVVVNRLKTGEAGKAVAIREASGDILALVDSDNILDGANWLTQMVAPFADPDVAGSEPWAFVWDPEDSPVNRYCALVGANDPVAVFLGNYDRQSALSGRWTDLPVDSTDRGSWIKVRLDPGLHPTIGANGFTVRADLIKQLDIGDYYFDIDIVHRLVQLGHSTFAKVKIGIHHLYSSGLRAFQRKQLRRINDFHYYRRHGLRAYPWKNTSLVRLSVFALSTVTVFPLLAQSLQGYLRKPDRAWWLHAPMCWVTLLTYSWGSLAGLLRPREHARDNWQQFA
jgi:glycosyltransferase involved in cell wall biosynthesis